MKARSVIDGPIAVRYPRRPGGAAPVPDARDLALPAVTNAVLAVLVLSTMVAMQALAARAESVAGLLGAAVVFTAALLPLNSLIHEAEHRMLAPRPVVNEALGIALSAFFPASLAFTRHTHLGHHRRNRTDDELFDQYHPHESRAAKRFAFYALYLGAFWLAVPLGALAVAVVPRPLWARIGGVAGRAMVAGLPPSLVRRIRIECGFALVVQAGLFVALDLHVGAWAILYGVAGVVWSSQQGLVHAGTPRQVVEGARDLALPWAFEALLLHWNRHLTHHRYPRVPWIHLPRFAAPTTEGVPYLRTFAQFWRGPRPCVEPAPSVARTSSVTAGRDRR